MDTIAPQPAIDSLSKTLLKAGETSEVSWHADENAGFQLRVGGADCDSGTILDSGPYSSQPAVHVSNVTAADLQEGANTLRLCLTDAAGNRAQATTSLSKDTAAPETTISTHPADPGQRRHRAVHLLRRRRPGSGIASFECRRDSGSWDPCTSRANTPDWPTAPTNSKCGRSTTPATPTPAPPPSPGRWTPIAPQPAIDSLSKTLLKAGETSEVSWHADENAGFQLRVGGADCDSGTILDSGAYSSQPAVHVSNVSAADLQEGANTLRLCLTDAAGNRAQATTSLSKDTAAPETTVSTHPATLVNVATAQFTFSGDDGSGSGIASFECRRDAGSWDPCSSGVEYTGLAEGAPQIRSARDRQRRQRR